MASENTSTSLLLIKVICTFIFILLSMVNGEGLKVGFYAKTCPDAEAIVRETIDETMAVAPSLSGPLLRMHFHDCFVRGCDASILLTSPTKQAEKDAIPNLTLRGFQIIDKVKLAVEKRCPGIVSCADILALAARDVTVAMNGPSWKVETGRRDGMVSNMNDALKNLPAPSSNISTLKETFHQKGLSAKDLVVLSGAHTLGISHCSSFNNRLYNFTGNGGVDPALDSNYIRSLKTKCKPGVQNGIAEMDPGSFKTFDNKYYMQVAKRRGLFESDAALLNDKETRAYVELQLNPNGSTFYKDFGVSMVNMGRTGVLTGNKGEVRKICTKIN